MQPKATTANSREDRHADKETEAMETCPECGAELDIPESVMIGEILNCADCGAELEVMAISPLCLSLAPEEEDWGE